MGTREIGAGGGGGTRIVTNMFSLWEHEKSGRGMGVVTRIMTNMFSLWKQEGSDLDFY